jgi:DNA (cytosine-5)-methyltransferase 1
MRPAFCFFENVEGHLSLGLSTVISDLEEDGYRCAFGLFSASEVGAPHRRKRVFILAHRDNNGFFRHVADPSTVSNSHESQDGISGEDGKLADRDRERVNKLSRKIAGTAEIRASWYGGGCLWPSRPGQQQYEWEPPRVVARRKTVDDTEKRNLRVDCNDERQTNRKGNTSHISSYGGFNGGKVSSENWTTQSSLGGDPHGPKCRMGYAELCVFCDNRTDELRLLGNGVVPSTAELAFRTLFTRLLGDTALLA